MLVHTLSNTNAAILAIAAGIFIGFALISSFVLPRRNPNFPGGRGLRWYVPLCLAFFVMMMGTVLVFGVEEEHAGAEGTPHETTPSETTPEETTPEETTPEETTPEETTPAETMPEGEGNAEAGAAVWTSAGCSGCHTMAAAGSTGTIGPNLDDLQPDHATVVEVVTNGKGSMPPLGGSLSEEQIHDVAAYVVESTQG